MKTMYCNRQDDDHPLTVPPKCPQAASTSLIGAGLPCALLGSVRKVTRGIGAKDKPVKSTAVPPGPTRSPQTCLRTQMSRADRYTSFIDSCLNQSRPTSERTVHVLTSV